MAILSRSELRKQIFESMRKCSETRSRILENITHTRRLMASLNAFYHPRPLVEHLISYENATEEERKMASAFIHDFDRFPIEFPSCDTLNDGKRRVLASGFAALRVDFIPQFDISENFEHLMLNQGQPRAEIRNAVLEAMEQCSEIQCASHILKEVSHKKMTPSSLRNAIIDGVRGYHQKRRDKMFTSMHECTTAWSNPIGSCNKETQRLMKAISKFYHPFPGEEYQFGLETATDFERETMSSFINDLPIAYDCTFKYLNICQLRRFIDGLSALRIELLPQLQGLSHHRMRSTLLSIGATEDRIRERLFFRVHAKTVADNYDDFPESTCMKCATRAQHWDRDMHGRKICTNCHLRMRLVKTSDDRLARFPPVEKCGLSGKLRYSNVWDYNSRNDLAEQLRTEYALTD